MGYVRTAGMSTAARRARRRAALVITSLLAGLALVFGLAFASMQGWITWGDGEGGTDDAAQSSSVVPPPALDPGDIVVNVYNASDTAGAAGRAAEALRARGYAVDLVANDPLAAEIPLTGVIRHGPLGQRAAQQLLDSLPVEDLILVGVDREDGSVDLVLGNTWEDLPSADDAQGTEDG